MGCRSSQKKIQRYRPKIDVQGKIFVFALFTREKCPKINKIEIWLKSGQNTPKSGFRGPKIRPTVYNAELFFVNSYNPRA